MSDSVRHVRAQGELTYHLIVVSWFKVNSKLFLCTFNVILYDKMDVLSVPKFTANLYCIYLSIDLRYTKADAMQICGIFWDTQ